MKALNQNFKKTVSIPNQVLTVSTNGSAVDTYLENRPAFETALIDIAIGALGTQASTGVKIEESDDATFATGVSVAKGGEEVTVAASTNYKREVERTKQYLRAVVTITTPGATPSVGIYVGIILWNAQTPFPAL